MVSCARCGEKQTLSLVIIPYEASRGAGRVLVYCPDCQKAMADHIGETIPLAKVSRSVFLDLYRNGKTASDPFTAVELVFGRSEPDLIREAQTVMNAGNGSAP